jgi:hypothetical protein
VTYETFEVSELVHSWLEDGNSARPVIWQHLSNVIITGLVFVSVAGAFVTRIFRLWRVAKNGFVFEVAQFRIRAI